MRVGGLGTQNKGDIDVGPSGQAFGREEQTSPEGRVSERKMAAVPGDSGVDVGKMCCQVFLPQHHFGRSHAP